MGQPTTREARLIGRERDLDQVAIGVDMAMNAPDADDDRYLDSSWTAEHAQAELQHAFSV